ncbi:hypothetical protein BESB_064930 [Besnoitia besnoiti]|uniref:Uncharacterized protein n=1 Tax=Besnoitia besnoiti TaxID=94643 RepID=A0A2A9MGF3_BESBE|nr:hypothetical protein BESB_064930 [Besnoitia besnoiti]PFH34462.1 hypothetical protein BESB_064930 [Besnoitia besnoiti]
MACPGNDADVVTRTPPPPATLRFMPPFSQPEGQEGSRRRDRDDPRKRDGHAPACVSSEASVAHGPVAGGSEGSVLMRGSPLPPSTPKKGGTAQPPGEGLTRAASSVSDCLLTQRDRHPATQDMSLASSAGEQGSQGLRQSSSGSRRQVESTQGEFGWITGSSAPCGSTPGPALFASRRARTVGTAGGRSSSSTFSSQANKSRLPEAERRNTGGSVGAMLPSSGSLAFPQDASPAICGVDAAAEAATPANAVPSCGGKAAVAPPPPVFKASQRRVKRTDSPFHMPGGGECFPPSSWGRSQREERGESVFTSERSGPVFKTIDGDAPRESIIPGLLLADGLERGVKVDIPSQDCIAFKPREEGAARGAASQKAHIAQNVLTGGSGAGPQNGLVLPSSSVGVCFPFCVRGEVPRHEEAPAPFAWLASDQATPPWPGALPAGTSSTDAPTPPPPPPPPSARFPLCTLGPVEAADGAGEGEVRTGVSRNTGPAGTGVPGELCKDVGGVSLARNGCADGAGPKASSSCSHKDSPCVTLGILEPSMIPRSLNWVDRNNPSAPFEAADNGEGAGAVGARRARQLGITWTCRGPRAHTLSADALKHLSRKPEELERVSQLAHQLQKSSVLLSDSRSSFDGGKDVDREDAEASADVTVVTLPAAKRKGSTDATADRSQRVSTAADNVKCFGPGHGKRQGAASASQSFPPGAVACDANREGAPAGPVLLGSYGRHCESNGTLNTVTPKTSTPITQNASPVTTSANNTPPRGFGPSGGKRQEAYREAPESQPLRGETKLAKNAADVVDRRTQENADGTGSGVMPAGTMAHEKGDRLATWL